MENIYTETLDDVRFGARFSIDLQKRNLKVSGKHIIENGKYDGELGLEVIDSTQEALQTLEPLYIMYKHSVPSERSESRRRTYFKAIPEKDMTEEDMLYGENREVSRFALEFRLLCYILNGSIVWDDIEGGQSKWFWQSQADKDFIILKSWVVA